MGGGSMYSEYNNNDYFDSYEYQKPPVRSRKKYHFKKNGKNNYFSLILMGIGVLVIVFMLVLYNKRVAYYNSYQYVEDELKASATNYIKNNNYSSKSEYYINYSKLNVTLKDGCEKTSGVFVQGGQITPYLVCDNYESSVISNNEEYIKLNGPSILFLAKGIDYIESSYLPLRNVSVKINGRVGSEIGIYNISYTVVSNGTIADILKRKVVIVDDANVKNLYPSIYLKGNAIEHLTEGDSYVDKGVLSVDSVDGVVKKIQVNSNVNSSVPGEYEVTYIATNTRGYSNAISRKVIVSRKKEAVTIGTIMSPTSLTNDKVRIIASVFGNDYAYTILPDGTTTKSATLEYYATVNGEYTFRAYNTDGVESVQTVKISNIYKTPPTGVCEARLYPSYTMVTASGDSYVGISSYDYNVQGTKSGTTISTTYTARIVNPKNVSVTITDRVGNSKTVECSVKQMDPTIGNNKVKSFDFANTKYVVVNTKNDVYAFYKAVHNKISQSADPDTYGSSCLSFAQYHTCELYFGNMNMSLSAAGHYQLSCSERSYIDPNKQNILKRVYDEILAGYPVVLMVNGNKARTSRHFVTVVGYKSGVLSGDALKETDLLIIDAWSGDLTTMDPNITGQSRRTMFAEGGGYRLMYIVR